MQDLESHTDEELIRLSREVGGEACLDVLYRRYYRKVAYWCLRICGDSDLAADLSQDVFLRVHDRLDSFRGDSRFSTWLYTLTRRVAINRLTSADRRRMEQAGEGVIEERVDPAPDAEQSASRDEIGRELRRAMQRDLEPLEASVLYLHYVQGMTLPAITELLELDNKSGAKAYVVNGRRKLEKRFGRWLRAQDRSRTAATEERR